MKKIICLVCLCIAIQTQAQMRDTTSTYKIDEKLLFKKAAHQKTAAWLLLAGGTALFIAGESIIANEAAQELSNNLGAAFVGILTLGYTTYDPPPVKHSAGARVMAYGGLGAMLGSIPFFISAHKNKKAANLIIKNETLSLVPSGLNKQLAMGVKINL